MPIEIRDYTPAFNTGWIRCRALAVLGTAEAMEARSEKDEYPDNPIIELVAVSGAQVVAVQQYVINTAANQETSLHHRGLGAWLGENFVHPDYQHQGLASRMLAIAESRLRAAGVQWLEVYTADDVPANNFYRKHGFQLKQTYWLITGGRKDIPVPNTGVRAEVDATGVTNWIGRDGLPVPYLVQPAPFEVFDQKELVNFDILDQHEMHGYLKIL